MKKACVPIETAMTHGSKSRLLFHGRRNTKKMYNDISQFQNRIDPFWPPHSAVMRRKVGVVLLLTR